MPDGCFGPVHWNAQQELNSNVLYSHRRMEPYTRLPIYGYAAAKSARTIGMDGFPSLLVCLHLPTLKKSICTTAGLLDVDAGLTDAYVREVDHNVVLTEGNYTWVVGKDVMAGEYRFGLGFYRHEASHVFTVVN